MTNREGTRTWLAVPFLLGAAAAGVQVLRRITDPYWTGGIEQNGGALLFTIVPFVAVLGAIGRGWADPRRSMQVALVALTFIGPAFVLLKVLSGPGGLEPIRGLVDFVVVPAPVAAAAGLLGGLRGRSMQAYGAVALGGLIGFLVLAVPLNLLGIGGWAECSPPGTCDVLGMLGLLGGAVVLGVIAATIMTPAFLAGALIGHLARPSAERTAPAAPRPVNQA